MAPQCWHWRPIDLLFVLVLKAVICFIPAILFSSCHMSSSFYLIQLCSTTLITKVTSALPLLLLLFLCTFALFFFVLPLLIWTFDFQKAKEKRRDAFLSLFFVLFFPGVRGMFVSHMSPSLSFLFKNKTFGVTSGRFHRLKKIKRTWIEYHKNVFISCFFETIDGMFSFFVFYKLLSFSLCAPLLFSFFSVSSSCCSYNFRNF